MEGWAFSPDGRWRAGASRDGVTRVWDTAKWHSPGEATSHAQGVVCVAFTPDSKTLITGGRDWRFDNRTLAGPATMNPAFVPRERQRRETVGFRTHSKVRVHQENGEIAMTILTWIILGLVA